jgi:NADH:ubiquinone oxidoreductase subunit K
MKEALQMHAFVSLKLLVVASLLILCVGRSTDSLYDSEILLNITSQLHCCHSRVCVAILHSIFKQEQQPVIRILWTEGVKDKSPLPDFRHNMETVL